MQELLNACSINRRCETKARCASIAEKGRHNMEFSGLVFYAVVCGSLSFAAPMFGSAITRLAVGAGVGLIAAIALPMIQGAIGY